MSAARLLLALAGAATARRTLRAATASRHAPALQRTNFRGRTVTLASGPALAVASATSAATGARSLPDAAAALTAGLGAGAFGLYDDVIGQRPDQKSAKGFRGHLGALRHGRVTSGLVKIVGVGAVGLAASALLAAGSERRAGSDRLAAGSDPFPAAGGITRSRPRRRRPLSRNIDVLLGAGVIAGTANLMNLLDLRPGRALKAGVLLGTPLAAGRAKTRSRRADLRVRRAGGLAAGPTGAAAALLPDDLGERVMLGDCGANALGAQLGLALAARTGPIARAGLLAGIVALTAASERVSFTQVIERTPGLRELDGLGRRRDPR